MKVVSAHQPAFMPWIGLIHKVLLSDTFIFMNIAKFRKRAFMHRNRIEINDTAHFIGLKLSDQSDFQLCDEISVSKDFESEFNKTREKILFSYKKSPYIDELEDFLLNSFTANDNKLNDICLSQLNYLCKKLKIDTNIIKESEIMSVEDTKK